MSNTALPLSLIQKSLNSYGAKSHVYFSQSYDCLRQAPSLFVMRKVARIEAIRAVVGSMVFQPSPATTQEQSIFEGLDIPKAVQELRQTGCYDQLQLPPAIVKGLIEFAKFSICYGDRRPDMPFYLNQRSKVEERMGKPLTIGSYLNSHETCSAFQAVKNDPGLLALARGYLGCEPAYLAGELFWSFPRESNEMEKLKAAQVFHYDIDDYRSLKLFFYLTDVDESAGPHVCIKGSHVHKKLRHQILGQRVASISDAKLVEHYGAENVSMLCGQAGFGFAEDPYCLHKGMLPTEKPRLLLQLQFNQRYYPDIRAHQGAPT